MLEDGAFGDCEDIMVGYDIGCGFSTTASRSPRLSGLIKKHNLRFCVNGFHGHAHVRRCQLRWHVLYQTGVGLEDLETCERLFSDSNRLARSSRQMSRFHRRQALVHYITRWNNDKFLGLGSFPLSPPSSMSRSLRNRSLLPSQ